MATPRVMESGPDLRLVLKTLVAVEKGDFSVSLPRDWEGIGGKIADSLNNVIDLNRRMTGELDRIGKGVGKEGKLSKRVDLEGGLGSWASMKNSVNGLVDDLSRPITEMTRVIGAVSKGDFSQTVNPEIEGRSLQGEFLGAAKTVNAMVEQLGAFTSEVTRVAREVGTDGKLGGQAKLKGVSGTWKDLTDSVNSMASNLTAQVRNISDVTISVANGDLSKKIAVDVRGEFLQLKDAINTMVDQLRSFSSEVTRVAREVGTDGKLGGQAVVPGVAGVWKDLTDNVNGMAGNLTVQLRDVSKVATAIAQGDLGQKITVDVKGEILQIKDVINTMVDQLRSFASEVTRVAREVGTEGKLGGQAQVQGVAGTWKDLTDNVNSMAGNLTAQVRNTAEVATAIANGDLSRKITVDVRGEFLQLKDTINTMVDQLNTFAGEVTRVAREVGTEGKLGGQAQVKGVAGTWKDLTDNVNSMAGNLTVQLRDVSKVATAIAQGDLGQKITVDVKGEILQIKDVINTMVDQLRSFASEVTRVAREVGTEGKLGGQARVEDVAGTWKDLTDNVNSMAGNLTGQVRNIAEVATAIANGDLSKKITVDVKGEILELKNTINTMVDQLSTFSSEVTRVAREVGTEGKLGGQAQVQGVAGTWKDLTDNVNSMAGNLTGQVRNIALVTTAVANGDLSKKITVDVKGEILQLKDTINTMVDQLNTFAGEVTRVAREVGTEGKLGGQAQVQGVAGTWKDLTDNVNSMAGNLTDQVRGIARVVTAVANGDLKKKLTVEAKGEIASLADTINNMIDTLATFADQVTSVAREVGVEGKLGGQARVPGASGTWKDLTDNVNQLAANLTNQVRAIADVATAVTKGDLTRSIGVAAEGEVAVLKDNINEMIRNLKDTTEKNTEQDWLKTNLAKFTRVLQGQREMLTVCKLILSELAPLVNGQHGVFYIVETPEGGGEPVLHLMASYAYKERKNVASRFRFGEGIIGQCAFEKQRILLTNVPSDYIQISSGLGEGTPLNIITLPVLFEGQVKAVIELASFDRFSAIHQAFLDQLTESIGIVLNTIEANTRTEALLKQSQSMAEELQSQQEELQQTNEELEEKARLLSEQKTEVERKNLEVEQAKRSLEEKAEQLALTSKYKSEFLSNMSHELRTPLNSLLILSQQLAENPSKNLSPQQVEFAGTIHSSGNDLLSLINDILDLSKIESGTVTLDLADVSFPDIRDNVERNFRHVADTKKLGFEVLPGTGLPPSIQTDSKRLQQVLKNLLSNAFKFTAKGKVTLTMASAARGWSFDHEVLGRAKQVMAFSVTDTGIGIAPEKQKIIFEAFQQADGSTSRRYGGTGLGLAISREITALLGGEIVLSSKQGEGSTFTLYLPVSYLPPLRASRGGESAPPADRRPQARTAAEPPAPKEPGRRTDDAPFQDDLKGLSPGDRVILIVEDDVKFAKLLLVMAREKGFKGVVALRGDQGLSLAREIKPEAITLDIVLPDMDGWTILDRLKTDPETRHIPVHIISVEEGRERGLQHGAVEYLVKPVSKKSIEDVFARITEYRDQPRKLLVVDDNEIERKNVVDLIGNGDVVISVASSGEEALDLLKAERFDCMVLDLMLPGISGFDLIEKIRENSELRDMPVIIYTGKDLTNQERERLEVLTKSIVVKDVRSPERLLDETALFLHRMASRMPEAKRKMIEKLYQSETALAGKLVLVVDDDVRNIFALTTLLERYNVKVLSAENGKAAIEMLEKHPDIHAVLMDVMMPEMDGYEATRAIRKMPRFQSIPIIALTAKAMKGDREKCLEAGASDYIAKPVNTEQLLSLLRVWLYR